MSTNVIGFRPADKKWEEMKAVYDAFQKASVPIPLGVSAFFNDETPDECGVEVDIEQATKKYSGDCQEGFEIDLSKLPKDITILRFFNSY